MRVCAWADQSPSGCPIGLLKTSGDDGAIESRVGSRERSVFISVPQGLKVGGEFTLNPGS